MNKPWDYLIENRWEGAIVEKGYDGIYVVIDKDAHIFPKGSRVSGFNPPVTIIQGQPPQRPGDLGRILTLSSDNKTKLWPAEEVDLEWVKDVTIPFFRKLEVAVRKINMAPGMLSSWINAVKLARLAGRSIRFMMQGTEWFIAALEPYHSRPRLDLPHSHPLRSPSGFVRIRIRKIGSKSSEYRITSDVGPYYQGNGSGGAQPPVIEERRN